MIKNKSTVLVTLCLLSISLSSCSAKADPFKTEELSYDGINLYFNSSDDEMNNFLNDYTHRNMRYDNDSIGEFAVGAGTGFAKNWETIGISFQNACKQAYREDKFDKIANYLLTVSQDEYGMVYNTPLSFEGAFSEAGVEGDGQGYCVPQGWPFPSWQNSVANVLDWGNLEVAHTAEFNFNASGRKQTIGSLEEKDCWHVTNGSFKIGKTEKEDGYGHFNTNGDVSSNKEFKFYRDNIDKLLPLPEGIDSRYAPIIDIEFGYTGNNVKDYGIYFKVKGDEEHEYFASQSIYASTRTKNVNGAIYVRQFFDMYLCEEWNNKIISEIGVKFIGKDGTNFKVSNGTINYLRPTYDTRQSNATYQFILAVYNFFIYSRNTAILERLIPVARKALLFLTHALEGENGLLSLEYLYGHDGVTPRSVDPNDRMSCHGVSNGYWDLSLSPIYNFEANVYFYQALKAMAVLEQAIDLDASSTKIRYRIPTEEKGDIAYNYNSESLLALAATVKENIEKDIVIGVKASGEDKARYSKHTPGDYEYKHSGGFYNPETGRFVNGINEKTGEVFDFGYVYFNLEAICAGIGTPEQQLSIMNWIDGQREVSSDTSKGKDIYFYEFAPRANTKDSNGYLTCYSEETLYNQIVVQRHFDTSWSRQVQNGGAVIAWSYYDLVARAKVLGVKNALERLNAIKQWYSKVLKANGSGYRFYDAYYDKLSYEATNKDPKMDLVYSIQAAANGGPGALGLTAEFIENIIFIRSIPDALYGMDASINNNIQFTYSENNLHSFFEIFNMKYGDTVYSLRSKNNVMEIFNISGVVDSNHKVTFRYKTNSPNLKVSVNDSVFEDVEYIDGYACVTVPFGNVRVTFG